MKQLRIYCDTSVFGGCFDEEFKDESLLFFEDIKKGKFILVVSVTVLAELDRAPESVQKVLSTLSENLVEFIEFSEEIANLRDEYIKAGIVGASCKADAEHIASAPL